MVGDGNGGGLSSVAKSFFGIVSFKYIMKLFLITNKNIGVNDLVINEEGKFALISGYTLIYTA